MNDTLKRELITCFTREFQFRYPQFELIDSGSQIWIWGWKFVPQLTLFVLLQAMEREDRFTLEVAWSADGEFPWAAMGESELNEPEGRERLNCLGNQAVDDPFWDIVPEMTAARRRDIDTLKQGKRLGAAVPDPPIAQVLPRVEPLVLDMLQKFAGYGIRLFRDLARARGYAWPLVVAETQK